MLHTLRQLVNDDEKWRSILRGMNVTFYHQTVTTNQIEQFIAYKTGLDLKAFFDQYLRTTQVPTLEYKIESNILSYRWTNCVKDFAMPITVMINGKAKNLEPKETWSTLKSEVSVQDFQVKRDFYVLSKRI